MKIITETNELQTTKEIVDELGLTNKHITKNGYEYYYKQVELDETDVPITSARDFTIYTPVAKVLALISRNGYNHSYEIIKDVEKVCNIDCDTHMPDKFVKSFKAKSTITPGKVITKYLVSLVYCDMSTDEVAKKEYEDQQEAEHQARLNKISEVKLDNGKVVKYKLDGEPHEHNVHSIYGHVTQNYLVVNSDEVTREDVQKAFNTFRDTPLVHVLVKGDNPYRVEVTWYND